MMTNGFMENRGGILERIGQPTQHTEDTCHWALSDTCKGCPVRDCTKRVGKPSQSELEALGKDTDNAIR